MWGSIWNFIKTTGKGVGGIFSKGIPTQWASTGFLGKRVGGGLGELATAARGSTAAGAEEMVNIFSSKATKHAGGVLGAGAAFGALYGAVSPDDSVIGSALKTAALFSAYDLFFPAVGALELARGATELAVGFPSAMERSDTDVRMGRLMTGYERSSPIMYDPSRTSTLRKRSLQYITQSRQNTRSFIGSEAAVLHNEGGRY